MANVNIKEVSGGQKTIFSTLDALELDDGTTSAYILLKDIFKLPSNVMVNGKISPTVSSNDLVLTLLTLAGSTPSTSDPVIININGTIRTVTAATTFTLADGTNWFNAGGAELATKEIDYFVYVVWDSNSSIVALSCSRIPYGNLVSDFSATTTNEKHLANYANFISTDDVSNIGRFAATLSAGAGYTWTIPSYTNINLIQHPILNTRMLNWQPVASAVGGGSFAIVTTDLATYQIDKNWMSTETYINGTVTGTVTAIGLTAPFEALQVASTLPIGNAKVSGGLLGNAEMAAGTPDIIRHFKYDGSAITTGASVVKSLGRYEI